MIFAFPLSNRLVKLKGDREGQYRIRINDQYRICEENVLMKTSKIGHHMFILLAALLPLFSSVATSATADAAITGQSIQGTVYYSDTPVAGIQISLIGQDINGSPIATTVSDNAGHYVLANIQIPAGIYWLRVSSPGSDWVGSSYYLPGLSGEGSFIFDVYVRKNLTVLQPKADAVVTTLHPVFCWQPLAKAVRYSLQINLYSEGSLVEYQANITNTCYKTSNSLQVGSTYEWFLSAWDGDNREIGVNYAFSAQKFQIDSRLFLFLPYVAK